MNSNVVIEAICLNIIALLLHLFANLKRIKGYYSRHTSSLRTVICLLFLLILTQACQDNPLEVDVSHVQIDEIQIERVDSLWPELTPVSFRKNHPRLIQSYGDVYTHYVEDVLQMGGIDDTNLFGSIRSFTTHPDFKEVFLEVDSVYPDLGQVESELMEAWKHYRYYFPEKAIPNHMACVGGFNTPFILTEHGVGICLELYLGKNCRFYDFLQWPLYQRTRMTPDHLVPWLMKGWLETEFPLTIEQASLLEEIVRQGKVFYCLDAIMPHVPDSVKIGYSSTEMKWARDHERLVWTHFVDNELLFSKEPALKGKFTNDGPFTVDLVKDSPSRMGHFIGWQMVREYMEDKEVISLKDLLSTPAERILKESNYKP